MSLKTTGMGLCSPWLVFPWTGEGSGWGRWELTPSPHLHPFPYFEALDTDNSCTLTFRDVNYIYKKINKRKRKYTQAKVKSQASTNPLCSSTWPWCGHLKVTSICPHVPLSPPNAPCSVQALFPSLLLWLAPKKLLFPAQRHCWRNISYQQVPELS